MKGLFINIGLCFLVLAFVLSSLYYFNLTSKNKDVTKNVNLSYLEDTKIRPVLLFQCALCCAAFTRVSAMESIIS